MCVCVFLAANVHSPLLQEEKIRHQQQYPEYRYQPKRASRSGRSISSPSGTSFPGRCNRCNRAILSPTTTHAPQPTRPILPPLAPVLSTAASDMNGLALMPSSQRRDSRQHHAPPRSTSTWKATTAQWTTEACRHQATRSAVATQTAERMLPHQEDLPSVHPTPCYPRIATRLHAGLVHCPQA